MQAKDAANCPHTSRELSLCLAGDNQITDRFDILFYDSLESDGCKVCTALQDRMGLKVR